MRFARERREGLRRENGNDVILYDEIAPMDQAAGERMENMLARRRIIGIDWGVDGS
jgi:hypothetical protein